MKATGRNRRVARQTLLIVCEGDAEITIVRHLKAIYRDALGRAVQEVNAHGKGGRHVLEKAIRHAGNRAYDKVILLLDTDTDWNEAERDKARRSRICRGGIGVVESNPCLEAWLLMVLGIQVRGDTRHCKRLFRERVGCEAHEWEWMKKCLDRKALDDARQTVPQLAELMQHMGIAKP